MLYVFGNCQAANISSCLRTFTPNLEFRWIHSPAFFRVHKGSFGEAFHKKIAEAKIPLNFLRAGVGYLWRPPLAAEDPVPSAMIFTLFPEQSVLYVDKLYGNGVFLNPKALERFPCFAQWIGEHFKKVCFEPEQYLSRYLKMLGMARGLFPAIPLVVVLRSRHGPAYGPNPSSLNLAWNQRCEAIVNVLKQWAADDGNLRLVDADRIVADCLEKRPGSVDRYYPQIVFDNGDPATPRRDMEHAGAALWSKIARAVVGMLTVDAEPVPAADMEAFLDAPYEPSLSQGRLVELLQSGDRLSQMRALAAMVMDSQDHAGLLTAHASRLVQHWQILNSLCAYARAKPHPLLTKVHQTQWRLALERLEKEGDTIWWDRFSSYLHALKKAVESSCSCTI
jgi:hypothetical protein